MEIIESSRPDDIFSTVMRSILGIIVGIRLSTPDTMDVGWLCVGSRPINSAYFKTIAALHLLLAQQRLHNVDSIFIIQVCACRRRHKPQDTPQSLPSLGKPATTMFLLLSHLGEIGTVSECTESPGNHVVTVANRAIRRSRWSRKKYLRRLIISWCHGWLCDTKVSMIPEARPTASLRWNQSHRSLAVRTSKARAPATWSTHSHRSVYFGYVRGKFLGRH